MMKINLKTTSIALVLLLAFAMFLAVAVQAQDDNSPHGGGTIPDVEPPGVGINPPTGVTPDYTAFTTAYLSFRPNPVGLNQPILVNMWVTPPPSNSRVLHNYKVTISKPSGDTVTVGPMNSYEADGTNWFEYTVDEVGEWTLKFEFPGQYFPNGTYVAEGGSAGGNTYSESVYYQPASTGEQTLVVQDDIVYSWPAIPLPTDYWTRPVHPDNREWWPIMGNYPWPWDNPDYDYAGPFVIAPNTQHVVWRRQGDVRGLSGGELYISSNMETGIGSNSAGYPPVILEGRAYETFDKPGVGDVAICYNIRTGEIYYEKPLADGGITPQYVAYSSGSVGVRAVWELIAITGGRLLKIDPFNGEVITNVTAMSGTFHDGAYVLSVQNLGGGNRSLLNWTTAGSSSNFESRIVSNISWPMSSLGTTQDYDEGVAVNVAGITGGGAILSEVVTAYDMNTGDFLWNATVPEGYYSSSCDVADEGKVAILGDRGHFYGYNIKTGHLDWVSDKLDYPWDQPGFGAYDIGSAYGMFYKNSYSGVYAFNWDDGTIAWKYEFPAIPYETPYINTGGSTVYSWNGGMLIADGKIFDYNTEHSLVNPMPRGYHLHAINATTGEGIWNITGYAGSRNFRGSVADGYLAFDNFYDAYMYVFGKGKSETTISAPGSAVPMGNAMMITGKVLDMSPAQTGTPCVSAASMRTQMEYLHMQMPIDGLWHNETIAGVPVILTAIHSDGTVYDLGTTTSNGYYGTFGKAWTPTKQGTYEIIANFAGDDSYGSSADSTFVVVGPAPSEGQEPETEPPTAPPTAPPTSEEPSTAPPTSEEPSTAPPTSEEPSGEAPFPTTEVIIVAAIAVVVVIGIGAYWALRRRK